MNILNRLTEELLLEEDFRTSNSIIHETCFGIFVKKPSLILNSQEDYIKAFESIFNNEKIPVIKKEWENYSEIVNHARGIAKTFRKEYLKGNIRDVIWAAKNERKYSPADIVIIDDDGRKLISLKYKKGQLGNFTINKIFDIFNININHGSRTEDNFLYKLSLIDEKYRENLDALAEVWAHGFYLTIEDILKQEKIDINADREELNKIKHDLKIKDKKDLKDLKDGNKKRKSLTRINTIKQWLDFVNSSNDEKYRHHLREISKKFIKNDRFKAVWQKARKELQNEVLKDFFKRKVNTRVSDFKKKLIKIFETVYGMRDDSSYIFMYDSGKYGHYMVPSIGVFERQFNFDIEHAFVSKYSDFRIEIYIKKNNEYFIKINIFLRWKNGQMIENFNASSQVEVLPNSIGSKSAKRMTQEDENKVMRFLFQNN